MTQTRLYGYKKLKEMVVIHMNIRNLYKDIKRDMERNGKDKTLRNFTPARKMTYEQMLGILHETKRDSMSMNWNGNFTKLSKLANKKVNKDNGSDRIKQFELERLLDLIDD